ncbi:MAG TPA: DUF2294 domain-containing protein [Spirochaetota bacterium]|nr:DUF2294 domain-containing protein [Spirochaetota bacterium]HPJ34131.1 DUF2294 domain-containing protein [Spirochaetota bacterium]
MTTEKSRGMVEAEICEAVIRFEKEYMGRGPSEARTYIIDDMILVRLKGVLTKGEEQLSRNDEGFMLVKELRTKLLENARPLLEALIYDVTGLKVKSLHTDISTSTGERVILFILEKKFEERKK